MVIHVLNSSLIFLKEIKVMKAQKKALFILIRLLNYLFVFDLEFVYKMNIKYIFILKRNVQ